MGRRLASLVKGLQIQHNGSSWKLTNRLGAGGFAEVWEVVTESRKKHAVKFDLEAGNASVFHEHRILAKLKPYDRIVHVLKDGDGWFEGHFYFAMDLQGRNVAELQRACLAGRFDLATCKSFGVSMLEALEQVHSAGYVHRDVKPANFVQGRTTGSAGSLYILDFGVARRFRDENSRVKPQRMGYDEFRGSTTYASINALHKQDQGRRDDVWSWLYMLAEMLNGHLPWKDAGKAATNGRAAGSPEEQKQAEKQTVLEAKLACLADPSLLFTITPLPEPIGQMSRYLETMEFEAEPDYQLLRQLLGSLSQFPCDAAAASAAAFQAQADFDSEGSFPASPASPPDDARGFMPQPRPMMAPTSYIPGMQDPAFPQAASPASSHGDEDDVGDAPALLAELAGANTADGYGHGMFTAPELDYGISGDDSAAATPAQIGALEPASDETADHQLPDGPPSAQSGYPFPDSGHTLQQEGQLVGESPTADIVPRLGTPPVLSGVPTAASSRPAVDLPPPPPRLGGMIQQDGFRPDRAPYFVVPPTGPIKLPIPARPGVTPRGQPQQNGGPFTRSRSDPNEEAAAREPGPASAERQLPPQLPGRLPEEAAAGKKRQADSAAAAEAPFKLQRTGSGSPVASPRLPSNHVANVAPTNGSGRSWGLEGGSRQQAQQFAVPEARPANGDTKAGWHAADGHRHLQGGLHPDATGSHAQGNPGDTHARDRSRERSRSRGLWPDDRDKLPAPRAHSHDRDRSQRPEAHSNSRDEGLTGRRDESARNRYAPRNDHRPSGRDGGRDESPRQPQQIRAPLHERRDRSESIQPRSVGRQANMRDGRAGERMLPYEVWARSLKQHTEALQDSDPYKELQDQARKFEKGGPGVPGFAAELKGDLNRLDAVELQSVVAWIVEYKLHSRSQAHDLNRVSNLIEDVSHFAHQTSKRAHQRYKDQR
ncbi:hypothetical protein WJX84_005089 [Apatococcus fuscideae]|uniref:Protein kinase domain-containing protein n=1 Tax=Apatococcus fuscideae TaxID=2026836 RepID=A0AAW1T1G2_9CHLO